jgi:DNA primase small subunit
LGGKKNQKTIEVAESLNIKDKLGGETDEPVTSDIKRLIRLPSSLHGKTGFVVTPLLRDDVDNFDPLSDAIPDIFTKQHINVNVTQPIKIRLKQTDFDLKPGKVEVPEFTAIFLLCRRLATIS